MRIVKHESLIDGILFLVLALLLVPSRQMIAQSPVLLWNAPGNAASVAEAQALIYKLYVNNGPAITVPGVTCSGSAPYACSAPLPTSVPSTIGTRLELTATSTTAGESARSLPFLSPPDAPTNLRRQ